MGYRRAVKKLASETQPQVEIPTSAGADTKSRRVEHDTSTHPKKIVNALPGEISQGHVRHQAHSPL
jgi:hypothetical protein